jgi:hypothetical protein
MGNGIKGPRFYKEDTMGPKKYHIHTKISIQNNPHTFKLHPKILFKNQPQKVKEMESKKKRKKPRLLTEPRA